MTLASSAPAGAAPLAPSSIPSPPPPRTVDDLGLPAGVVNDLALKVLYTGGGLSGQELAQRLCVPYPIISTTLRFLADEGYCSTTGMSTMAPAGADIAAGMQWVISASGRERARELLELNQYAGPVPIPVEMYAVVARHQAKADLRITRAQLCAALGHLVLSGDVIEALGPALNARHTVFLYGPPGNGKTSIAESCASLLGPPLFVPRALWAHGEIIRFFDPANHIEVAITGLPSYDTRWVPVQRPAIKVGGELDPRQLELSFDSQLGFYEAAIQLKANGGLLLIDDFGRQTRLPSRDLLNRLIVPLEKGVDYLNLARAGTNVAVPFTTMVMLSTNLRPEDLMDEAFLRRVRHKVLVPGPTEAEYRMIWRQVCTARGVTYDAEVVDRLIYQYYRGHDQPFRGVHPRDLLNHVIHAARFQERPVELAPDLLDAACATYFVRRLDVW